MSTGGQVAVGAGAAVVAVAVAAGLWVAGHPEQVPAPKAAPAPVALAPVGAPAKAPATASVPAPTAAPVAAPVAPSFDVVRYTPDGAALVAGRGAPGATAEVAVEGVTMAKARISDQGQFVAMFTLPPATAPRSVALTEVLPDGRRIAAAATVILGPSPKPAPNPAAAKPAAPGVTASEVTGPEVAAAAPSPAPTVLMAGKAGVQVLQPGADAPKGGVTVDAISYGASGEVMVSGRGTGGQSVRLYIDDKPVLTAPVANTGKWSAHLPGLAPGVYTLRADQIDANGKVTARFETPFKREAPSIVAAAEAAMRGAVAPAAAPSTGAPATTAPATAAPAAPVAGAATALAAAGQAVSGQAASGQTASGAPAPVQPAPPAPGAGPAAPGLKARVITVQPGYTLWGIAEKSYGDGFLYVKVFQANKGQIRDPNLIYPGQVFTVPEAN